MLVSLRHQPRSTHNAPDLAAVHANVLLDEALMGLLHVLHLEDIARLPVLHPVDGVRALAATSHEAPNLLAFGPHLDPDVVALLAHVVGEPNRLLWGWEGLAGVRHAGDERGEDVGGGRRHGDFVVPARPADDRSLSGDEAGGALSRASFVAKGCIGVHRVQRPVVHLGVVAGATASGAAGATGDATDGVDGFKLWL